MSPSGLSDTTVDILLKQEDEKDDGHSLPSPLRMPPFPPETGTLLSASQTFFAPRTGTPSSLRDTPSNRGNYLTGELPFKEGFSEAPLKGELSGVVYHS